MILTYYGLEFFKVQHGDLTVAYNPISAESKNGKPSRFGADIALVSANHPDFNGTETLSYGEKRPFPITGPGEYETNGVYVRGLETFTNYDGGSPRLNTIYYLSFEGVYLCFLGAIDKANLGERVYDAIHEVDILFVPVGGEGTLSPSDAHKLSLTFSPKIIIPMHYDAVSLKKFLKEAGKEDASLEEKFTFKKKDLEGKEGEVVVLKQG